MLKLKNGRSVLAGIASARIASTGIATATACWWTHRGWVGLDTQFTDGLVENGGIGGSLGGMPLSVFVRSLLCFEGVEIGEVMSGVSEGLRRGPVGVTPRSTR